MSARRGPIAALLLALALLAGLAGAGPVAAQEAAGQAPEGPRAEAAGSTLAELGPVPLDLGDGYRSEVEQAWFRPGGDTAVRANDTRIRALELGAANVEPAARALIASARPSTALAHALLAVRLAPDLPVAHMALSSAQWREGQRTAALESALRGLLVIPRHLEATLWLASSLLVMFAAVLVLGSFFFVVCVAIAVMPHAAHDLGDLFARAMPSFARVALLACLLLLPLLAGEGLLGLVLVLFALGFAYGTPRHRMALALAAVMIVLGIHPLARVAGIALRAIDADPVADAALAVVQGTERPEELDRLVAASGGDPLAQHVLALKARRLGLADDAHERYSRLLAEHPSNPILLTNLGNLRFHRGETEAATDLYERSVGLLESPILMFNLSQSYARAFRMEEFESAMRRAQEMGSELVAELSRNGDPSFVADVPLPVSEIRDRLITGSRGADFARALSRPAAPGRLGEDWTATAAGFAGAALLALLVSGRYEHSSRCSRCGRRICSRCDGTVWNSETCNGCHNLFHRPETTDAGLRMTRLASLRDREARRQKLGTLVSLTIPGVGGLVARRPDLAFVGILFFGWALVSVVWRDGVVPDPLALGAAGPLALALLGTAALIGYVGVVFAGLVIRRRL